MFGDRRQKTALAYHRVTTSQLAPFGDILKETLTDYSVRPARRVTRPAYSLDELQALEAITNALDGVCAGAPPGADAERRALLSRGALREWLRLAAHDATRADARWRRFREVSARGAKALFEHFEDNLAKLGAAGQTPWEQREADGWSTAVGDALAWNVVQPLGRGEARRLWQEKEG